MVRTLERYQKCSYGASEPNVPSREALEELSNQQEYLKLKQRYDALQRSQRNLSGEDLDPLNTKELEALERQLGSSLKQIQALKTQNLLDQLKDLQYKEQLLFQSNKTLMTRLSEGYHMPLQSNVQLLDDLGYGRQTQCAHANAFSHPLDYEPILQIGYQQHQQDAMTAGPSVNNYTLGWLPCDNKF